MPHASAAPAAACLRAILRDDAAQSCPAGIAARDLVAVILALLLRLLARSDAAWALPTDESDGEDLDLGFDEVCFVGETGFLDHCIGRMVMGRAPHAACVEAGLVGDWIIGGIHNRGMRPAAPPAHPCRHARIAARAPPARPPPHAHPFALKQPPSGGADSRPW